MVPEFRTQYNYDTNAVSDATALFCLDESRTVQDAAEDADINTIVRRFGLTGQLPDAVAAPVYGDFEEVYDYHTALIAVRRAEESFMSLPAEVRSRFHNNPQALLEFCSNAENRAEAEKLGLVIPQKKEAAEAASEASATP